MEEISLQELYFIIRKWLWLIVSLMVVFIVISAFVSIFILKKEYQANTTLMVGKPKDYMSDNQIEYNDLMLNQKLVSTYSELIKTRRVSDQVIKDLDLDMSTKTFASKVNVSLVKDTELIKVEVTDNSPKWAAAIANSTANVFMKSVKDIWKVENVQVIDRAQAPTSHTKPRVKLNIAIAGVLGLMLGVFIAFLIEFLDNTIKTANDIEKHLGISVIGEIPMYDN